MSEWDSQGMHVDSVMAALRDIADRIEEGEFTPGNDSQFDWWTLEQVIAMEVMELVVQGRKAAES